MTRPLAALLYRATNRLFAVSSINGLLLVLLESSGHTPLAVVRPPYRVDRCRAARRSVRGVSPIPAPPLISSAVRPGALCANGPAVQLDQRPGEETEAPWSLEVARSRWRRRLEQLGKTSARRTPEHSTALGAPGLASSSSCLRRSRGPGRTRDAAPVRTQVRIGPIKKADTRCARSSRE